MHYIEEKYGILAIHDDERHARVRRIFAPAFSDRALRRQEAMIVGYADMLVTAIARASSSSSKEEKESLAPVDMCKLWTCATFDIMGKLTFGEPLGMLEAGEFTPWVRAVFAWNKAIDLSRLTLEYPVLDWLAKRLTPRSLVEMERMHHAHSADRVDRRLEQGSDEPDIWNLILSAEEKGNGSLDKKDMYINAGVFMIAGTETTATLLSGLTWLLCKNPEKMAKLCAELRERFEKGEQVTAEALARLPYLNACLEEGLRLYPPLPIGPAREVCEGGNVICGEWIPAKVSLSFLLLCGFLADSCRLVYRWLNTPLTARRYTSRIRSLLFLSAGCQEPATMTRVGISCSLFRLGHGIALERSMLPRLLFSFSVLTSVIQSCVLRDACPHGKGAFELRP